MSQQRAYRVMRKHGRMTSAQLAEHLGCTRDCACSLLYRMKLAGCAVRVGGRKFAEWSVVKKPADLRGMSLGTLESLAKFHHLGPENLRRVHARQRNARVENGLAPSPTYAPPKRRPAIPTLGEALLMAGS